MPKICWRTCTRLWRTCEESALQNLLPTVIDLRRMMDAVRDWQIQEATEFAGRTFKRLMYFTCEHPDRFLPEATEVLTAF